MRRHVFLSLAGSGIVCLALGGECWATAPRAFVSINGSDLNPCSAVQPCRSFNQALTVVQAGGEIVVQDSGGYSTGFTITQSVTIDAAGFNASVISTGPTDLCTINAGASDRVVLRGISFHGAAVGANAINATQVGSLYVEHCSIAEFTGNGVNMPNGGKLFVTSIDVRACSHGIDVGTGPSTAAALVGHASRFTECIDGVLLRSFGANIAVGLMSDCTASLCTGFGFGAASTSIIFSVPITRLGLIDCRTFVNSFGLDAESSGSGQTSIYTVKCVLNDINGDFHASGANALVFGTNLGTNLLLFGNNPNGGQPNLK
jgi:hypothetical protein